MGETITVRIPKKLRAQLNLISKEKRIPASEIVRESLQNYLTLQRFRKLRSKVLPFAEVQGLLTDEDIFQQLK